MLKFRNRKGRELVIRYFADKFPIFIEDPNKPRPNILSIRMDLETRQNLGLYCRFSSLSQDAVVHRALQHLFHADTEFQSWREREKSLAVPTANDTGNKSVQVVFTYFDNGEIGTDGFTTHLKRYKPLFDSLQGSYKLLYVSNKERNFKKAEAEFQDVINPERDRQLFLDYFPRRLLWQQKKYKELQSRDIDLLNSGEKRFVGAYFEHLYETWKATENTDEKAALLQLPPPGKFEAYLIERMKF